MLVDHVRRLRHGPLKGMGPLWNVLGSGYRRTLTLLNIRIATKTMIGAYGPFRVDARFAFSNFGSWGRGKNPAFHKTIEACRGARCILDIGAHIGLMSLPMSSVASPVCRIFAFEPAAYDRMMLERHLAYNEITNVEIIGALVGRESRDDVPFFEMDSDTGLNSVVRDTRSERFSLTKKHQVSIDDFCQSRGLVPDVIKMDIEGAEFEAIEGAVKTIREHNPLIFLSVHPPQLETLGHSTEDLKQLLEGLDRVCYTVDGSIVTAFRANDYVIPKADLRQPPSSTRI